MRVPRALLSVGLICVVAACSSPPPPAPIAPAPIAAAPTPATSGGGIDGVYLAPPGGARGNSACGTTVFRYPIRVAEGMASMQTVSAGRLEGSVAPDGSLLIEAGNANLRGQFTGNRFDGTYSVGRCSLTLAYRKR